MIRTTFLYVLSFINYILRYLNSKYYKNIVFHKQQGSFLIKLFQTIKISSRTTISIKYNINISNGWLCKVTKKVRTFSPKCTRQDTFMTKFASGRLKPESANRGTLKS